MDLPAGWTFPTANLLDVAVKQQPGPATGPGSSLQEPTGTLEFRNTTNLQAEQGHV
jgi:hypothetical protein